MKQRSCSFVIVFLISLGVSFHANAQRPSILFVLADDMSYPFASVYGNKVVTTPNLERIASHGMTFTNAYCASPSCTPSRAAILAGRYPHKLGEAVNLTGKLDVTIPTYVKLLQNEGYAVAYDRKGWGPGDYKKMGYSENPAGKQKVFKEFLKELPSDKPFFFWFGTNDPHRTFPFGKGRKSGIDIAKIDVPSFLPDTPEIRGDMADYFFEINRLDKELGDLLNQLEQSGRLDNTIIVVTGDNGMPFPHAKANLYDYGTHVPLIIGRISNNALPPQRNDSFVNLIDLTPTFLDWAGVKNPPAMDGISLVTVLTGQKPVHRSEVFLERERHCLARSEMDKGAGYPMRAIRTKDFLYILNLRPDRFPGGDESIPGTPSVFGDVDGGPTKAFILDNRLDPEVKPFFELGFGKRSPEELYLIKDDPGNIKNLAPDPDYSKVKGELRARLEKWMQDEKDPRAHGGGDEIDRYKSTTTAWVTMWGIVIEDEN